MELRSFSMKTAPGVQESVDRSLYRLWGSNIKEARGTFWSQQALAEVCGISSGALSNIESGRRNPSDWVKWRIAGALRRPVGELFPWPGEIPPFPKFETLAKAAS